MARRRGSSGGRDFPRTARLNELLREIIAERLERLDDDRLAMVSITEVDVDAELTLAKVYVSVLDEGDEVLAALDHHRRALKAAIASEARIRRTPDLTFALDPAIGAGDRVEEILRGLREAGELESDD